MKYQCCPHIETIQFICCGNQLTGFYMRATLAFNGLKSNKKYIFEKKNIFQFFEIKETHREKAPSNKTPGLTKSTIMGIWVVGTSNQPFIRGS